MFTTPMTSEATTSNLSIFSSLDQVISFYSVPDLFSDYIVIGTGSSRKVIDPTHLAQIRSYGIKVDFCSTFEAISTHNFCIENDYNHATFLLPEI